MAGKFYYDRKKKFKSSVWRVVLLCQFLVLAGNRQFLLLWRERYITTGKKSSSRLSGGLCCCVSFVIMTGKKSSSRLSGGCAIVIMTGKKVVVVVFFTRNYTRFAWAGGTFFLVVLYVVSVFCSGRKKVLVQICMF